MLYAILCYDSEEVVGSWTEEQDAAVIAKLDVVQEKLARAGKLGPVVRLQPSKTARTLRKGAQATIVDGPFAETKEVLLGFYVVDCATEEEALAFAKDLGRASSSQGAYEVRALRLFRPGTLGT